MLVVDSLALQDKRRVRARVGSAAQAQGAGDAVSAEPAGRRGEQPPGGRGLGAALPRQLFSHQRDPRHLCSLLLPVAN